MTSSIMSIANQASQTSTFGMDTPPMRRESNISNDSGQGEDVITTQPTRNPRRGSSNIRRKQSPADDDQCCMFKIGSFMYGFPNEETQEVTRRSSERCSHVSVISDISDSAFSELSISRHQSFLIAPSKTREALIQSVEYINANDSSNEHSKLARRKSKSVSFAMPSDEADSENHTLMDIDRTHSMGTKQLHPEEDSELDFILQCINDSRQRSGLSAGELAGKRFTLDNFAAIYVGKHYGAATLTIPDTGCSLYIPPFAMLHEEPELVYIYQPTETPHPISDSKEAWATPIIECGPSGYRFAKPVFLSVPYKFALDVSQMRVSAYHSKGLCGKWEGLRDGDDTLVIPQEKKVTILIHKFCKYGCTVQQEATKWMQALVQVHRHEDERECTVKIQLCDIDKVEPQSGEKDERLRSAVILVNNNGGHMNISINGVDRRWKLSKGSIQQIPCDQLWSSQPPFEVTFSAELKDNADDVDFSANVDIFQDDNDQPRVSLQATSTRHPTINVKKTKLGQVRQTIDQQFLQTAIKQSPHFIRQDSHQNLCAELDTAFESCGWKQLGNEIGFEHVTTLQWMEHYSKQSGNYSPGSILIDFYLKDTTDNNIIEKLQCLSNYLQRIHNEAAKRYVDEEISLRIRAKELQVAINSLAACPNHYATTNDDSNSSNASEATPARQNRLVRATSVAWSKTRASLTTFSQFVTRRSSQHDGHVSTDGLDDDVGGETNEGFNASENSTEGRITIPKFRFTYSNGGKSSRDYEISTNNNDVNYNGLHEPMRDRKHSTDSHDSGMGPSRPDSRTFPTQQLTYLSEDIKMSF